MLPEEAGGHRDVVLQRSVGHALAVPVPAEVQGQDHESLDRRLAAELSVPLPPAAGAMTDDQTGERAGPGLGQVEGGGEHDGRRVCPGGVKANGSRWHAGGQNGAASRASVLR